MKKIICLITLLPCLLVKSQISFEKNYGKNDLTEWGYSAKQTKDNGYILLGNYDGPGGITLYKIDEFGNIAWNKDFTGIACYSVEQTNDEGYVLFGFKFIKTDGFGNEIFSKDISELFGLYSVGYSIKQLSNNDYIVTGGTIDGSLIVGRTSNTGDTLWTKKFGKVGQNYGQHIELTSDNNFIAAGSYFDDITQSWDFYVVKVDQNGNEIWSKNYGGNESDHAYCIKNTSDNGYIVIGETESYGNGLQDVYIVKTDSNGNKIWEKTYGGSEDDYGRYIYETDELDFIFTGGTESFGNGIPYYPDIYVGRINKDGDLIWENTYGKESMADGGSYIEETNDGGMIIFGGGWNYISDMVLIKLSNTVNSISINVENPFEIHPNPFFSTTTVKSKIYLKNATVIVENLLGEIVQRHSNIFGCSFFLTVNDIPKGIYLAKIFDERLPRGYTLKIVVD